MQSTSGKVVAVLVAVVAAMGLFLVLQDDDEGSGPSEPVTNEQQGTTEAPPVPTIVVENGKAVDGVAEYELNKGDRIRFTVRSDVDDQVHLHGYDVSKPIKAGGTASFDVPADIEGVFEVELEESGIPIAEVTVNP